MRAFNLSGKKKKKDSYEVCGVFSSCFPARIKTAKNYLMLMNIRLPFHCKSNILQDKCLLSLHLFYTNDIAASIYPYGCFPLQSVKLLPWKNAVEL